jgi:hypothetical protein
MPSKTKQIVKDSTAVSLVVTSAGLFVLRACRQDKALSRAGRNAVSAALLAAPLAGGLGFIVQKESHTKRERDQALEATAAFTAVGGIAAGALGGLLSLAWDAFRA